MLKQLCILKVRELLVYYDYPPPRLFGFKMSLIDKLDPPPILSLAVINLNDIKNLNGK